MLLRSTGRPDRPGPANEHRQPVALEQACPGRVQTVTTAAGKAEYWLIRRDLADVAPDSLHIARQYAAVMRGARISFDELKASAALCRVADLGPQEALFMDTETCGFSGTAIFLVGMMFYEGRTLTFEQHLARNYAEESAILQAFADRLSRTSALVTFNGKAFDMNMIRERSAFHAVCLPQPEPPNLDLLHESRRRWRGQVPNFRLQTLERHLIGRHRHGDINGSEIPDAYHQFVKTADARRLKEITHHNLLDLLTLSQLLCAILTGCDPVVE